MRRYTLRLMLFMGSYMAILTGSLLFARNGADHAQATLIGLALISAFPIVGVFWAIFRLLVEIDDEYQRLLFVKQTLLATALTLAIVTVWQFLKVFGVVTDGPQWMGAIWFAMLGIATPIVRWRA
ncbi:hypothetical protein [Blastomonas aquatica]|uniref:DUF2178 domain-containing protein n=2 Tax=Blastomonas aquatica TaxID=1510276 RepID=A0ABQ1IYB1_9SPHN|nr:hypothetical protein GCM10010833_06130 [Blastomonas aquatica]